MTAERSDALRKLKARLTRLLGRVGALRAVLGRFLEDDGDMRDLYITRRAQASAAYAAEAEGQRAASMAGQSGPLPPPYGYAAAAPAPSPPPSESLMRAGSLLRVAPLAALAPFDDKRIEEAESLLETYWVLLDETGHKLEALDETIHDTEDLVNVVLDYHRNMLLQFDVVRRRRRKKGKGGRGESKREFFLFFIFLPPALPFPFPPPLALARS